MVASPGDATAEAAAGIADVEVIQAHRRMSAGAARNLGAEQAPECDLLVFVDADCRLQSDCLEHLLEACNALSLAGAGAVVRRAGGGLVAWLRHALEFKEADGCGPSPQPWQVPSATLLVRRTAFEAAGAFPDLWPGEDLVLCDRLRRLGMRVERVDRAVSWHSHPRGLARMLRHQYRLGETSARARLLTGMAGVAFAHRPALALMLWPGRMWRAVWWFWRYRRRELAILAASFPLYAVAVGVWTIGFIRGARRASVLAPHRPAEAAR